MTNQGGKLVVAAKHQLADAQSPDDDWTGLRDAAERRKRQNRLNVRAHRRRKAEQSKTSSSSPESIESNQVVSQLQLEHQNEIHYKHAGQPIWHSLATKEPIGKYPTVPPSYWDESRLLEYTSRLPVDQRLITLIQYNVLRACATNMSILNLVSLTFTDCKKTSSLQLFPAPSTVPESLKPTALQCTAPHDRWIDLIPSPQMRDNAIRLAGSFDGMDLCDDIVGGLYEGFEGRSGDSSGGDGSSRIENNGMLAWSDPWHVSGWELTEGFVRKWSFLLKGCWDMVEATNEWRRLRGEDGLVVEI